MDFEENKSTKKKLFLLLSLLVIAIVAISAVSISRFTKSNENEKKESKNKNSSYTEQGDAYNNDNDGINTPAPDQNANTEGETESTAKPESGVPYSEEDENKKTERSFVMPVTGEIIKPYSATALQYSETYGDMRLHEAIDIKCEEGSKIKCATDGTVKEVTQDANLGRMVIIDHGDGIVVKYCGLKDVYVKSGELLDSGTVIGTSGTVPCECADPAHIHIEAQTNGNITSVLEAFGLQ